MGGRGRALPEGLRVMTREILVLSARPAGVFDGVGDFASALAESLTRAGAAATAIARDELGTWAALPPAAGRAVIVNYVPQSFLSIDFAPLLRWLTRARASGSPVVIVVHEFLPPRDTLKRRAAAVPLGWMLHALLARATAAVVTHDVARRELAALGFRPEAVVIPVGSAIAVTPGGRHDTASLVMFGQPASFDPALVRALADGGASLGARVVWLTRSAVEAAGWCARHGIDRAAIDVREACDAAQVSGLMGQARGALAPIVDGVSTRRTSVAAALAHGLPVAGTDGACTVDAFRHSPALLLSRPGDGAAFVAHARRLARIAPESAMMSAAAGEAHDAIFAWPRLATRYLELLRQP